MSSYNHICDSDYRNEGWTFAGSGVSSCYQAWNNDDDTKYAKCPAYKGRAAVAFPLDISSGSVPEGAVITSVTVWLRTAKTAGGGTRSVTVNILPKDDTARYFSRTLYPTTSVQTIEVGTYQTDPLGRPWTKHILNQMVAQVFSYAGVADAVRCYKLYAQINYNVRPTVVITAPVGTVATPSPVITWTYVQSGGDLQGLGQYKIFTATQQAQATFNPDTSQAVYSADVAWDITTFTLPTALSPGSYYVYVQVTSVRGAKSTWVGPAFTVQGMSPGQPVPDFGGIGTGAGGGFVSVVPSSDTSSAYITLRDGSNLLSVQQADFETTTDSLGYTTTNCAIAQDTISFFGTGSGSLKLTASSSATMSVLSSFVEVAASTPVTAICQFKTAVTARTANLRIRFYDQDFTAISGTISNSGTDAASTWTQVSCTGSTPAGAVFAAVQLEIGSPAKGSQRINVLLPVI